MNIIDFNTSNSAARIYAGTQKKHDTVNHRRVMMIDWRTRFESHAICKHADRNCEEVCGNLKLHLDAACCTFASLQASHCHVGFAVTRFCVHGGLAAPHAQGGKRHTGHMYGVCFGSVGMMPHEEHGGKSQSLQRRVLESLCLCLAGLKASAGFVSKHRLHVIVCALVFMSESQLPHCAK